MSLTNFEKSSHGATLVEPFAGNEGPKVKRPSSQSVVRSEETTKEQERLLAKVRQEIESCQYRAIRGVRCGFDSGILILSGSVPNYHCKQIAQEVVRRICGNTEIQNSLQVDYLHFQSK